MADGIPHRGALAHPGRGRTVERAALHVSETPGTGKLNLRGRGESFRAAVEGALGFALPEPNRAAGNDGVGVLWLGPDEWLVTCNADHEAALLRSLGNALAGIHAAVTDVTDTRTVTRVSGPGAREVLATGCTLDLHPRVFAAGHVAQSTLAKAEVILHQTAADDAADGPAYEIYVLRSFADYLWRWLEDAARA